MTGESFKTRKEMEAEHADAWDALREFQDGLKLEPGPPTVDDLVERRIAQAERVVALYRLWADTLWPRDLVGIIEDVPNEEPPTFQDWLEEQTAAIVKALAVPGELLAGNNYPANEPGAADILNSFYAGKADAEIYHDDEPEPIDSAAQGDEIAQSETEPDQTDGPQYSTIWARANYKKGVKNTRHWWLTGPGYLPACGEKIVICDGGRRMNTPPTFNVCPKCLEEWGRLNDVTEDGEEVALDQ